MSEPTMLVVPFTILFFVIIIIIIDMVSILTNTIFIKLSHIQYFHSYFRT